MDQTKRLYEATFIVNASLEDAQIEAVTTHVTEAITRNGGEILSASRWGRKRLAYPIQKKNNGFYVNLEFSAPGTVIPQLERTYLLDENILRFLTIQLDKKALMAREQQRLAAPPEIAVIPPSPSPTPVEKAPLFEDESAKPTTQS